MAKCKNCGTDIPEGLEYCEECLSKLNTADDSESYLDSLLSAVMTEEPDRREVVYPKKEASSLVSVSEEPAEEEPIQDELSFDNEPQAEPEPVPDEDVWDDFMKEFLTPPEDEEPAPLFDEVEPEEAPMEDTFGTFFDGESELPDLNNYSIFGDVDEGAVDRMLAEELDEEIQDVPDNLFEEMPETDGLSDFGETPEQESSYDAFPDLFGGEETTEVGDDLNGFGEELSEFGDKAEAEEVPASEFSDVEDLFGMLQDEKGADAPEEPVMSEGEVISAADFDEASDSFNGVVEQEVPESSFGDLSDLFDGLDGAEGMFDFGAEPEMMEESETAATLEEDPVTMASSGKADAGESVPKKEEKKQPGRFSVLFHKLFDDVKVDPSKIKTPPTKEELEAQKKAKQEEKERSKEEKEALLAEKKAQEKQERMEKQRIKNEEKARKKAKKMEEAKLVLEEIQRTRINRAGASIIFIFFIMIAVLVIVGSNLCAYSIGIRNAERQFKKQAYTEAYNEIYGLDVKDEDIVLYDRIMTVMYVQKQLNSYYNYYGMNDQPKALDSLLKGLSRYEKYIELAIELDVDSDLDYVRNKILAEIDAVFGMTEQEAMEIIQIDSRAEYSKRVYEAVGESE